MKYFMLYLLVVNALGMLLMIIDKHCARKKMRRMPEINLMMVAALGGSYGSLIGMLMVRHKTKHLKFTIGIPVMIFVHTALILLYFLR